jgi:hypothetical protein
MDILRAFLAKNKKAKVPVLFFTKEIQQIVH